MTAAQARREIQHILHVAEDGAFGPRTQAAYDLLSVADGEWPQVSAPGGVHHVKASSFADPADVRAFEKCKAQGNSDQFCFDKGDNGIGKWGDNTKAGSGPSVALPPEDWQQFGGTARRKKVLVTCGGKSVVAELRDTMPHKANIENGAGMDMNPDTCNALGLRPPVMVDATWQWV
jgi:hypothetical protein